MKIAIVPGSFDPMTLGHLDVVKRAAFVFDRVIVAVMINDAKKYTFSMKERANIASLTCKDIENAEVMTDSGLLVDLAKRTGACAVVKGVRNAEDYAYEAEMARYNAEMYPELQTLLLPCDDRFREISSTLAREYISQGKDLSGIMSDDAIKYIVKISDNAAK